MELNDILTPCKGCDMRQLHCHSACNRYLRYKHIKYKLHQKQLIYWKNDSYNAVIRTVTRFRKDKEKKRKWGQKV